MSDVEKENCRLLFIKYNDYLTARKADPFTKIKDYISPEDLKPMHILDQNNEIKFDFQNKCNNYLSNDDTWNKSRVEAFETALYMMKIDPEDIY